jgi:hypothetical protein
MRKPKNSDCQLKSFAQPNMNCAFSMNWGHVIAGKREPTRTGTVTVAQIAEDWREAEKRNGTADDHEQIQANT